MIFSARRLASIALFAVATGIGCTSMQHVSEFKDTTCEDSEDCSPPKRWSEEWYAIEAQKPVGARQIDKHGKLWPPFPRPIGEQQQMSHRYHAAHYWPYPYRCQDARYVYEVMERQVANGWQEASTLYDFHFDFEHKELNHSGMIQLRWILDNTPMSRRQIWVQKGADSKGSQERLEIVQAAVPEIVSDGSIPPIKLRVSTPYGRPADEIDRIRTGELATMPEPRVPYEFLSSGGG